MWTGLFHPILLGPARPSARKSRPTRRVGVANDVRRLLKPALACLAAMVTSAGVQIQAQSIDIDDETFADRPISEVEVRGLERTSGRLVRNNLRTASGQPFESQSIRDDVATLYRLGQFSTVTADATLRADGSVLVTFQVEEQAIIQEVETVGNSEISDQELRAEIPLFAGGPRDDFLVEQSLLRIKDLYRSKGHYLAEVSVDESRLVDDGILIFVIVEGPRVRIREVEFVGNRNYTADELGAQIKTKPSIPFFRKGELDTDRLIDDVAALDGFYKDRGWVDVRIDDRVMLSENSKDAKVVFVIDEGRQYRLRRLEISAFGTDGRTSKVLSQEQLLALARIRPGDRYRKPEVDDTVEVIEAAYETLGYVDVSVTAQSVRVGEQPEVDLLLTINEGESYRTGLIFVQGNFLTKDKVIRRLVRVQPGRPLDGTLVERAEALIKNTRLFNEVRVAIQQPTPEAPDTRDVIVEVKERNTGSFNFGAGIASDSGVFGEFSFRQQNFDIADFPLTAEELISGRAFRGAGQGFDITLAPGNEVSMYSVSLTEPHLFESNVSGQGSAYYRTRIYSQFSEERIAFSGTAAQRLGDVWVGNVTGSVQRVKLADFTSSTPLSVYDDRGPDLFVTVTGSLRRTTVNDPFRPSKGSASVVALAKAIPMEGNVDYWRFDGENTSFLTLSEDFLGRKQTLRLKGEVGWIFAGSAPTFERYYMGGRNFRGFDFRTISPKSNKTLGDPLGLAGGPEEPVGGDWLLFLGTQYEVPLIGESITGVLFVDSGTVTDTPGFSEYRVSAGFGIRLYLEALGPAPLAFDFGFPLRKQPTDEEQVFSFSAELPF